MKVELLVVPDCANARQAAAVLREALHEAGIRTTVETVIIDTDQAAEARRFIGSPSFYVDGVDLFPQPNAAPALACRMYPTEEGPRGTPSPTALARALAANCHP